QVKEDGEYRSSYCLQGKSKGTLLRHERRIQKPNGKKRHEPGDDWSCKEDLAKQLAKRIGPNVPEAENQISRLLCDEHVEDDEERDLQYASKPFRTSFNERLDNTEYHPNHSSPEQTTLSDCRCQRW